MKDTSFCLTVVPAVLGTIRFGTVRKRIMGVQFWSGGCRVKLGLILVIISSCRMECFCSAVFYFSWLQQFGEFNMSIGVGVLVCSGYSRFTQNYVQCREIFHQKKNTGLILNPVFSIYSIFTIVYFSTTLYSTDVDQSPPCAVVIGSHVILSFVPAL